MSDADDALEILLREGRWTSASGQDADRLRADLRRLARARGVRIRTSINGAGRVTARTLDRPTAPPVTGSDAQGRRTGWRTLTSWLARKDVRIAGAVLGAVAGIGISLAQYVFPREPAPPVVSCKESHPDATGQPLAAGSTLPEHAVAASRFMGCVDPAVTGAERDGLWTVDVVTYEIPGTSMADQFTEAQVFDTACAALALDYRFSNQGRTEHLNHTVQVGQAISVYTGESELLIQDLPDSVLDAPENDLVVLSNGRYSLARVECVPWPSPG